MSDITLPYKFDPRPYQTDAMGIMQNYVKRFVWIVHRRGGKDKTFWNYTINEAFSTMGLYYYFLPTYNQGRKVIWDAIDNRNQMRMLDHIPEAGISNINNTEMKVFLKNKSLIQVIGTDDYDLIVGTNPIGCVFSEYGLQNPKAWEHVRPILRENGGWAAFISTPRGYNHLYEMYVMAKRNPKWYAEILTVADTKDRDGNRFITDEDIQEERDSGMPESMIQQEYYCSFNALESAAFDFRSDKHVLGEPLPVVPDNAPIYMTFDWGHGRPFSIGWWWLDNDGRKFRFKEWYGWNGKANEGLRLTDSQIAEGILSRENKWNIRKEKIVARYAGHDCFNKRPNFTGQGLGRSTAEIFADYGIFLSSIYPDRAMKIRQFREHLLVRDGELPMLVVYPECEHFIRTIPMLTPSPTNIEDIDESGEDHVYDETCNLLSARPLNMQKPAKIKTLNELIIDRIELPSNDSTDEYQIYAEQEKTFENKFWQGFTIPGSGIEGVEGGWVDWIQ